MMQLGEMNLRQGTKTPSIDSQNSNGEEGNHNIDLKYLDGSNPSTITETSSSEDSSSSDQYDAFFNKSDMNKSIASVQSELKEDEYEKEKIVNRIAQNLLMKFDRTKGKREF